MSDAPLSAEVALPVLGLPSLVCAGMLLWARRRPTREGLTHASLGLGVTQLVSLGVLLVPALARFRGGSAGIVWAMSGDNRNQVQIIRSVIEAGGLTVAQLREYPAGIHGLTALNAVANGRGHATPAHLLEGDVRSLAGSWILAAIGIGVLSAVAVLLSLPDDLRSSRRASAPVGAVALGAGCLVGTGLFSGVALQGGFLSAFAGEALVLAGVVVAIRAMNSPHPLLGLLILADAVVLLAYRPLFALVVLLFVPVVLIRVRLLREWHKGWWLPAGVSVVLAGGLGVYLVTAGRDKLRLALEAPGAITAPSTWLVSAMILLALAMTLGSTSPRLAGLPPLVVMGSIAVMIVLSERRSPQPGLSYSSTKLVWAGCMVGAWLIFAHIARGVARPAVDEHRAPRRLLARATALSAAAIIGVAVASPLPSPVSAIVKDEWIGPNTDVIDAVLADLDEGPVVVPWLYANSFGEDRVGIFWSMTEWDPALYAQFFDWSYALTDGAAATMCPLVQAVPQLVVVTRDADLQRREREACGAAGSRVHFIVVER